MLSNRLADLAERIGTQARLSARYEAESIAAGVEAGRLLIEAKAECRHGEWGSVLDRADIHQRTAQRMMKLAGSGLSAARIAELGGLRSAVDSLRTPKSDRRSHLDSPSPTVIQTIRLERPVLAGPVVVNDGETYIEAGQVERVKAAGQDVLSRAKTCLAAAQDVEAAHGTGDARAFWTAKIKWAEAGVALAQADLEYERLRRRIAEALADALDEAAGTGRQSQRIEPSAAMAPPVCGGGV